MSSTPWDRRFFATTRGRILALLRRGSRTVDELAQTLDLTNNAVRVQLAALERDGLVEHAGVQRGSGDTRSAGKPAYLYGLTAQAERLFPKAFEVAMRGLLDVLTEELDPSQVERLLHLAGQRIAEQQGMAARAAAGAESGATVGDLRGRIERAVALLNDLGGLVDLEAGDDVLCICGYVCPLSDVSASHPPVCRMMQALLSELVGMPVQERCERSESLWCWFEVPVPRS